MKAIEVEDGGAGVQRGRWMWPLQRRCYCKETATATTSTTRTRESVLDKRAKKMRTVKADQRKRGINEESKILPSHEPLTLEEPRSQGVDNSTTAMTVYFGERVNVLGMARASGVARQQPCLAEWGGSEPDAKLLRGPLHACLPTLPLAPLCVFTAHRTRCTAAGELFFLLTRFGLVKESSIPLLFLLLLLGERTPTRDL